MGSSDSKQRRIEKKKGLHREWTKEQIEEEIGNYQEKLKEEQKRKQYIERLRKQASELTRKLIAKYYNNKE